MNSIEIITRRITDEADSYADETVKKARERANSILSDARIRAKEIRRSFTEKAVCESNAIINRAASSADILERNILLDAKSVILDQVYQKTLALLTEDSERYLSLLKSSLKSAISVLASGEDAPENTAEEEKSETFVLSLNEKDRMLFGQRLLTFGENLTRKTERKLILSDTPGTFIGGLSLRLGSIEISATLETIIKTAKEKTEAQVCEILFSTVEGRIANGDKI